MFLNFFANLKLYNVPVSLREFLTFLEALKHGLSDFDILSEQYYMHYDPSVKIIAETKFSGEVYPWIKDVIMPIAWKKMYGKGKVFFISIGHDPDEFMVYKDGWELLTRGFMWAVR